MKTIQSHNRNLAQNLFAQIANQQGSVWLDSSLSFGDRGQESLIANNPVSSASLMVRSNPNHSKNCFQATEIEQFISHIEQQTANQLIAVGYIGYEAACLLAGSNSSLAMKSELPLAHFYFYDSALLINENDGNRTNLGTGHPVNFNYTSTNKIQETQSVLSTEIKQTISKDQYLQKVRTIKEHIREGTVYQANFTNKFEVESSLNPFDVYNSLRKLNPAPYSAFINFGDYQLLSSSPERMFSIRDRNIISSPIKGTIKKGETSQETTENLNRLLNSTKDKAELLMIVDLVRNDLGRIAKTGTVQVDELFKPEIYSSLIHLVSDVSAKLKDKITIADIFKAILPGGSITGAPKLRAIEILNELETEPRHIYTGSIGYIYNDDMEFNIAIRTMTHHQGRYSIHAGGGIVADSDPEMEYKEMELKARNLFRALGIKEKI